MTPDLPPYGSFRINQSYQGNILGAKVADPSGQMLIVFSPGQAPRNIHKSKNLFFGPSLSYGGEIGVIATTEGTNSLDKRLIAFDLASGEQITDLWAGGMAGVTVANWAVMYEDESESLRGCQRVLFGGSPEETPEAHRKSSPITYAEQVQAPLLVIQGSSGAELPAHLLSLCERIDGADEAGALVPGQLQADQPHKAAANDGHLVASLDAEAVSSMDAVGDRFAQGVNGIDAQRQLDQGIDRSHEVIGIGGHFVR